MANCIIEFHGDSTQKGIAVYTSPVLLDCPPSKVVELMLNCEVRNFAVPGSTLKDALESPIICGKTITEHMAQSNANLFVCNWGINDAYIPGITPEIHKTRWGVLWGASDGRVVMETPNPITVSHAQILNQLITAQRTTSIPRVDIHSGISEYYPQWASHLSDGIHPNEIMYLYIGKLLSNGLYGMIT
jgi:hypothetical protein